MKTPKNIIYNNSRRYKEKQDRKKRESKAREKDPQQRKSHAEEHSVQALQDHSAPFP